MEDIFKFKVSADEFAKIEAGIKVVQLYIADNKHKNFAEGNKISFECENEEQKNIIDAEIETVLLFPTIVEAVESLGKERCGFKNSQTVEKVSDIFLAGEPSYEPVEKYGIGAIKFKISEKK